MSANVETMFSTRVKPWHGIGTVVADCPSSREAIWLAGLDWMVEQQRESIGRSCILDRKGLSNIWNVPQILLSLIS